MLFFLRGRNKALLLEIVQRHKFYRTMQLFYKKKMVKASKFKYDVKTLKQYKFFPALTNLFPSLQQDVLNYLTLPPKHRNNFKLINVDCIVNISNKEPVNYKIKASKVDFDV